MSAAWSAVVPDGGTSKTATSNVRRCSQFQPDVVAGINDTVSEIHDALRYGWAKKLGFRSSIKAFFYPREKLEDDEEQVSMTLEVFEQGSRQENYGITDFIAFTEMERQMSSYPLCGTLVHKVEQAAMCSKTLLSADFVHRCQVFMKSMLHIVQGAVTRVDGRKHFAKFSGPAGPESYVINAIGSPGVMVEKYKTNFGLSTLTENQPGDILKMLPVAMHDPYIDLETVDPSDAILIRVAIVFWAFNGYDFACRMCMAPEDMQYGVAASRKSGQLVLAYFKERGLDLNDERSIFGRYPTVSQAVAPRQISLVGPDLAIKQQNKRFVSQFREAWLQSVAIHGQSCMRARYLMLVGIGRRELVYIRRIISFQDSLMQQITAVGITAGITFGNFATAQYFAVDLEGVGNNATGI